MKKAVQLTYHSKYKVTACQQGHAYLTSHRVYYVDDKDPRKNSVAIDLKDVDRSEYQVHINDLFRLQNETHSGAGWLFKILSEDNVPSKASETWSGIVS